MSYSQLISWTSRDGTRTTVTVTGHSTHREALYIALRDAVAFGWTPPRWWQWWRWGDRDYTQIKP